ncbi:MAG TPA: guanylate kinase [Candidatus Magasanikbacteria bacterium]|jgi:guanylate kinase|nr:guanylate kinase [Candidatus Magasanikbacteria bacterium]HQF57447.1 guanylate kinase [Candidatus Magasanikbacteria bacterium]HQL52593.1 guanylate kinase [Candidatus Magasanikbacteria bacterium]
MNKGKLVIISSPSGGGKDSIISALLKIIPNSTRLITTTSREPRPGNQNGIDYYFVSQTEFENKIQNEEMVEYNNYAGNYYGIEKKNLILALENNEWVFTQIEVNGKQHLDEQNIPNISIFLLPENLEILAKRIRNRGGLDEEKIKERLEIAQKEINKSVLYDYQIVNVDGKFEETVSKIREILNSIKTLDS